MRKAQHHFGTIPTGNAGKNTHLVSNQEEILKDPDEGHPTGKDWDRERLRQGSRTKKTDEHPKLNAARSTNGVTVVKVSEIWMGCVDWIVELYPCWFSQQ